MEKGQIVGFRKIKGKIVPIRRKKGDRKKAAGAAAIVAGSAIAASGGKAETALRTARGKFTTGFEKNFFAADRLRAAHRIREAMPGQQMKLFRAKGFDVLGAAAKFDDRGARFKKAADLITKSLPQIKRASKFAGGALVAAGISSLLDDPKDSASESIIKNAGAAIAGAAFIAGSGRLGLTPKALRALKTLRGK